MILSILLLSFVVAITGTFWNTCCYYGSYGSYGSYGHAPYSSYAPTYSSYSQPLGGYTIWYPDALEYVNRRWNEYYSGRGRMKSYPVYYGGQYAYIQKGHGQIENYPERNHLYVGPYKPRQRPSSGYLQPPSPVAPPPPPPDTTFALPPAPPMPSPSTIPSEVYGSQAKIEEGFEEEKEVGKPNEHVNRAPSRINSEESATLPEPPTADVRVVSSTAPPRLTFEKAFDDIPTKVPQGHGRRERIGPVSPHGSLADVNPSGFRRLHLPGEIDEPPLRQRRGHISERLN